MDQHLASVTRRPRRVLALCDPSGCVDLENTVHSSEYDQLDIASQIEIQRWEDDGGAIVIDARRAPALAARNEHARAA
jgi:hypothetical protein